MCTVSWTAGPGGRGYELLFNRDELRTRRRAVPPALACTEGVRYAAPTDSDKGGTWIGVNEMGVTHCLLNAYGLSDRPTPKNPRSRGEIVRTVQTSDSPEQTLLTLSSLDLKRYPPWILIGIYPRGPQRRPHAVSFTWSGSDLARLAGVQSPVTTSSYEPGAVEAWRLSAFRRITGGRIDPGLRRLWRFHRVTNPRNGAFGVCMKRADARTVSCTRISCMPDETVGIGYVDGRPAGLPAPPAIQTMEAFGLKHEKALDLRQAMHERAPGLSARLPWPVHTILKYGLREARVNRLLRASAHRSPESFCERALTYLGITVVVHGGESLAGIPRPVFASNHPSGGIEGLVLMREILHTYGDVAVPANELLARITPLSSLVVPIDRYRGNAAVSGKYADLFQGSRPVLIFPAGRTARMRGRRLREFPWQKSFVTHARRSQRPVVPVWVSGQNSRLFNTLYSLRRLCSIPLNIEMFLLVRELFARRGDTVHVVFGRPQYMAQDDRGPGASSLAQDAVRARSLQRYVEFELSGEESSCQSR